jgi:CHASE2 domain-containing sensor protein
MSGALIGGRYKIIAALGAGGFGQTYLVEDTQQAGSSPCVVKQFKPAKDDARFLEIARRLFKTEGTILERLGQHPQIPQFLGVFESDQDFYLVQQFIDGEPLSDELARKKHLSEAEAIALLDDVLNVLEFVHANQVIHRDIKPNNLIRRHQDGKIVLIDFGSVKEIQTQLSGLEQTNLTVGIGTQGYTPSEQLAGQPRFCSDFYALGITVIQALTGIHPSQLPTEPDTGELIWQGYASVDPRLKSILSKMVRYHFSQRYQSAVEIIQAVHRLNESPLDATEAPSALLCDTNLLDQLGDPPSPPPSPERNRISDRRHRLKQGISVVTVAVLAITGMLVAVRQVGWLQAPETAAYDQMLRLRPSLGLDPRLLVVGITEQDLQTLQRTTPSDRDVAQVIQNLAHYQPRVIGLDLYRELPQEPGHAELLQQLQSPKLVAITKLADSQNTSIAAPSGVPGDRIGFNDLLIDPDGIVRRNLLFAHAAGVAYYSFSLRVALRYLAVQGITPQDSPTHPGQMQLGRAEFPPLNQNSGGYQDSDVAAGYQIMLNYRSAGSPARQISFTQALKGQFEPEWVRDKAIVIGTVAPSGKDLFYTPYSAGAQAQPQMAGVVIHTQMVSQMLSSALDGTQTIWFLPEWIEILWISGWAAIGGSLAWLIRHPIPLGLSLLTAFGVLWGTTLVLVRYQGWLPGVAPTIALLATGTAIVSYRSYQLQRSTETRILQNL